MFGSNSWRSTGIVRGESVDVVGHECLVAEGPPIHVNVVSHFDGLNSHHHETGEVHAFRVNSDKVRIHRVTGTWGPEPSY